MVDYKKENWAMLYDQAIKSVENAKNVIDNIAGYSGSAGNFSLQDASARINEAYDILVESDFSNKKEINKDEQ